MGILALRRICTMYSVWQGWSRRRSMTWATPYFTIKTVTA